MATAVDSNTIKARELSVKLEELILEAHFLNENLTNLYKKVDFCLEHGTITLQESKTLKNDELMKELANEIYA